MVGGNFNENYYPVHQDYPEGFRNEEGKELPPEKLGWLIENTIKHLEERLEEDEVNGDPLLKKNYEVALKVLKEELQKIQEN